MIVHYSQTPEKIGELKQSKSLLKVSRCLKEILHGPVCYMLIESATTGFILRTKTDFLNYKFRPKHTNKIISEIWFHFYTFQKISYSFTYARNDTFPYFEQCNEIGLDHDSFLANSFNLHTFVGGPSLESFVRKFF
jgi:hypothetical protein